jgi:hypothetical protein
LPSPLSKRANVFRGAKGSDRTAHHARRTKRSALHTTSPNVFFFFFFFFFGFFFVLSLSLFSVDGLVSAASALLRSLKTARGNLAVPEKLAELVKQCVPLVRILVAQVSADGERKREKLF